MVRLLYQLQQCKGTGARIILLGNGSFIAATGGDKVILIH